MNLELNELYLTEKLPVKQRWADIGRIPHADFLLLRLAFGTVCL